MKSLFAHLDTKLMLRLNMVSIIITTACVIFALFMFISKAFQPEITSIKFTVLLMGLILVSLLFIGSLASMVYFIVMKNRKHKKQQ